MQRHVFACEFRFLLNHMLHVRPKTQLRDRGPQVYNLIRVLMRTLFSGVF